MDVDDPGGRCGHDPGRGVDSVAHDREHRLVRRAEFTGEHVAPVDADVKGERRVASMIERAARSIRPSSSSLVSGTPELQNNLPPFASTSTYSSAMSSA